MEALGAHLQRGYAQQRPDCDEPAPTDHGHLRTAAHAHRALVVAAQVAPWAAAAQVVDQVVAQVVARVVAQVVARVVAQVVAAQVAVAQRAAAAHVVAQVALRPAALVGGERWGSTRIRASVDSPASAVGWAYVRASPRLVALATLATSRHPCTWRTVRTG